MSPINSITTLFSNIVFFQALPITFMSKYLIGSQGQVVLEDKDGVAWTIDWIAYMQSGRRLTFTRGWPAFVACHDIKDGDIFVAEIVSPEHWKVQVICSEVAYTKSYALCPVSLWLGRKVYSYLYGA
jgi:hypothetical protein